MPKKRGKHTKDKLTEGALDGPVIGSPAPEVLRALARRQAHVEEARHNKHAFIEYVLRDEMDDRIKQGRIHREWQDQAEIQKRLLVVAPRHHGKTQQAIGHCLWKIGRNVNELIKFVCAADKKAIKRLSQLRAYLKDSDDLHRVFPHLDMDRCVEWNKHMITLERPRKAPEPTIEALGITSSGTGDRATGIVVDDGVDRRNSITLPKTREAIKESWDDWYNLLGPDSWLLWICTLWHNGDLTHELMSNPEYAVLWYAINLETLGSITKYPDGTELRSEDPLWPERWGKDQLAERKRVLKSRGFARSFGNRPMADAEMRVKPEWVKAWSAPPPDSWPRVVILDLASSTASYSDPTGVVVLATNPDRPQIAVTEAYHVRLNFPDKVELVRHLHRVIRPEWIVVELSAGGRELMEHMLRNFALPIRGIKPHGASKGARLDSVTPYLEGDMIRFSPAVLRQGERSSDRGDLPAELVGFPLYPTDDILDAFCHGVRFCTVVYDAFESDNDDGWDDADEADWGDEDDDDDDGDGGPASRVLIV